MMAFTKNPFHFYKLTSKPKKNNNFKTNAIRK